MSPFRQTMRQVSGTRNRPDGYRTLAMTAGKVLETSGRIPRTNAFSCRLPPQRRHLPQSAASAESLSRLTPTEYRSRGACIYDRPEPDEGGATLGFDQRSPNGRFEWNDAGPIGKASTPGFKLFEFLRIAPRRRSPALGSALQEARHRDVVQQLADSSCDRWVRGGHVKDRPQRLAQRPRLLSGA